MSELVKISDVRDELMTYLKTGGKKRFYCGHEKIDKLYGVREGSRTDWSGYPGSGKTELLFEILWNTSQYYDHKHLIHMPDAGSHAEVVAKIFHKVTGKRLERFYWTKEGKQENQNLPTPQELDRYLPEIIHYFKIYKPSKVPTPKEFWDYAEKNKDELEIFSAVIDSWNYMKHNEDGEREDIYLAKILQYGNDLVERSNLHLHTVIHPRSGAIKMKDGNIMPPTTHEMKGGSEWGNYGKNVIIVHRPKDQTHSEIHVNKVKGANIGIAGMDVLWYDIKNGKYFDTVIENGTLIKKYASKELEQNIEIVPTAIQPNIDFSEPKSSYVKPDDCPF